MCIYMSIYIHTMHLYMYIYIYICVCVCVLLSCSCKDIQVSQALQDFMPKIHEVARHYRLFIVSCHLIIMTYYDFIVNYIYIYIYIYTYKSSPDSASSSHSSSSSNLLAFAVERNCYIYDSQGWILNFAIK